MKPSLSDAIRGALEEGRTVTIEESDRGGFLLEADGEPLTGNGHGLPWEQFDWPIDYQYPEPGRALALKLAESHRTRSRRRHRERVLDRVDDHTASEGLE